LNNTVRKAKNRCRIVVLFGLSASLLLQKSLSQVRRPGYAPQPVTYAMPTREDYLKLAAEMESVLRRDLLDVFFPRAVDTEHGGFHSNFTRDWKRAPSEGKFSVFQARLVWVAAQVSLRRPELKERFAPAIAHGLTYLRDVLWDQQHGGFYWGLNDQGQIDSRYTDGKHLYGNSFCIYGAAGAYQATRDPAALDLAQRGFRWIDEHAHDNQNGGYHEWLTRDGRVVPASESARVAVVPVAGFPIGYKSVNTHIHLLEAFTQLYEVWPDDNARQRIEELLAIVRDKICVAPGAMNLYLTPDWRAIPDHDSYGHDVEAAYLMVEAEAVLGRGHDPRTEKIARLLVDHALAYGWDQKNGGFFEHGTTIGPADDTRKEWWVQFEGLNALLLMHEKYGQQTDSYFKAFQQQWWFISKRQVDRRFGGIYDTVEADGKVRDYTKARIWKECYHDSRALLNTIARLNQLAVAASK